MSRITRVFLSGLIAALPLAVTVGVTAWLVSFVTDYIGPGSKIGNLLVSLGLSFGETGYAPYAIGLAIVLGGIYVLGLLVEFELGSLVTGLFEAVIRRIPLVSNLYDLSKRFVSIVDPKGGDNLKSMSPVWCFFGGDGGAATLALMPSSEPIEVGGAPYVGVLVPSAPVPFGGALIYVPQSWVKPADIGVEQLMSVYVSMGVTRPTPGAIPARKA